MVVSAYNRLDEIMNLTAGKELTPAKVESFLQSAKERRETKVYDALTQHILKIAKETLDKDLIFQELVKKETQFSPNPEQAYEVKVFLRVEQVIDQTKGNSAFSGCWIM